MKDRMREAAEARLRHLYEREAELAARRVHPANEYLREQFLDRLRGDIADTLRELEQ